MLLGGLRDTRFFLKGREVQGIGVFCVFFRPWEVLRGALGCCASSLGPWEFLRGPDKHRGPGRYSPELPMTFFLRVLSFLNARGSYKPRCLLALRSIARRLISYQNPVGHVHKSTFVGFRACRGLVPPPLPTGRGGLSLYLSISPSPNSSFTCSWAW